MTLDIFFARYLLTLHAVVVALGLMVYVAVARSLPQRRDPSAAIAWVVALALLPGMWNARGMPTDEWAVGSRR